MIGIVIVSHSARLAEGLKDLVEQATGQKVPIAAAGGTSDESLGTSVDRIQAAAQHLLNDPSVEGLLVLLDLGSAAMSAEMALETLGKPFILSNAPLVEGAVMAAVQASIGADLNQVATAALQDKDLDKLQR